MDKRQRPQAREEIDAATTDHPGRRGPRYAWRRRTCRTAAALSGDDFPWPPNADDLPDSDGIPMESPRHYAQMNLLVMPLRRHWRERAEAFAPEAEHRAREAEHRAAAALAEPERYRRRFGNITETP